MIGAFVELALTLAILLFLASLPFADHPAGGSLRRAAGFAFVMAFVPVILSSLFAPMFATVHWPARNFEFALAVCGLLAILLVLSFAAYGILDVAKRGRSRQPRAHAPHVPYTKRREQPRHDHGDEDVDEGDDA